MSGFLNRWSKRKIEARRDHDLDPTPDPAATAEGPRADQAEVQPPLPSDPEIAAQIAALPPLEDITAGTDIRPFLQDFVPRALKNAAMRRAWASDPIISTHMDVARDYAWEFNSGPMPVGFSAELGADAVKRGLDALNIAPPPENAAQSAAHRYEVVLPDGGDQNTAPHEDNKAENAPDLTAKAVPPSEVSPAAAADMVAPPAPAVPKAAIRLSPKRHGGALPD